MSPLGGDFLSLILFSFSRTTNLKGHRGRIRHPEFARCLDANRLRPDAIADGQGVMFELVLRLSGQVRLSGGTESLVPEELHRDLIGAVAEEKRGLRTTTIERCGAVV